MSNPNRKLTLKWVKTTLKRYDVTITRRIATREYRVNLLNGSEDTAYYATDLLDAVYTGVAMASQQTLHHADALLLPE